MKKKKETTKKKTPSAAPAKEAEKDIPKAPSSPVCYAQSDEVRKEYREEGKE